jgi:N-acyl-D-amino-acid deacylase
MSDRGVIAIGMAADVIAFDPDTIIDRATYENPALPAEGMKHVIVNGVIALRDGVTTGARGGRALVRTTNMPSRPTNTDLRRLMIKGTAGKRSLTIDLTQGAGVRQAVGLLSVDGVGYQPGFLQTSRGDWATVTGVGGGHAISLTLDRKDPDNRAGTTLAIKIDDQPYSTSNFVAGAIEIRSQK